MALYEEFYCRYRAATLDAPWGWIVFESYNNGLVERRESRRRAGIWSTVPDPAPLPVGHKHEEMLTGMRAGRKWKDHFSIKPEFSSSKRVL